MRPYLSTTAVSLLLVCLATGWGRAQDTEPANVSSDIKAVMDKPLYKGATWGLRVVDLDTGQVLVDLKPNHQFFIGSVRKLFTIGELLDQIGPNHRFNTPVYRSGPVNNRGVLWGDLILVASGDLTMGGRTKPDGTLAITNFDHNEANSLGTAQLTKPDPLAGYAQIAHQIARSGIKEITGDVVIDDRLFQPYKWRTQFYLKPIFVNDDVVDLKINRGEVGEHALVGHRPISAALAVDNDIIMQPAGGPTQITPTDPKCIGKPGCTAEVTGTLAEDYTPPFNIKYPLVRNFRITNPSNYARTVLIEQLRAAGVKVDAPTVEPNPTHLLPAKNCYESRMRVADLQGLPYAEYAKWILKVSYNIGADTSLLLWGVTQGTDDMQSTLAAEQKNLQEHYGIGPKQYHFVDGSGGEKTTAINRAVTHMLIDMTSRPAFPQYFASLPILGVDGSLVFVTDFESDSTLAPAKGQVHAKTGTFDVGTLIEGQAFAGYIHAKSGKHLVYHLDVNDVQSQDLTTLEQIFQDEGTISAMLWRDN